MIFISGMSRSGTTMLQGLICNSPQTIPMTAEASYFRALMEAYRQGKMPGFWKHLEDYFESFEEFFKFHRDIVHKWMNWVREDNRRLSGLMVQKEPRLLRVWPELYDFYPKASYVIIYRDPRDIVASQCRRTGNYHPNYVQQWLSEQMMNIQTAMTGDQENIWVRYEDLVSNPEEELKKVAEAINIEIPLAEWDSVRSDDSACEMDGELPQTTSVGKWKQEIPHLAEGIESTRDWFKQTTGRDWFYEV